MNKQGWPSEVVAEFEIAYIIMQGAPSILMNVKQVAVLLRTCIMYSSKRMVNGWLGNQREKNTTEVADKISSLKSLKDCPEIFGRFKINGKFRSKTTKLILELTRVLYPTGRCCRVIKPKEVEKNILSYMYLYVEYSNFTN